MGNISEDLKAKSRAAAVAAFDTLFKDLKFNSPAERERMATQLVDRLMVIYDPSSNAPGLTQPQIEEKMKEAVTTVIGRAPSQAAATERATTLTQLSEIASTFSTAQVGVSTQIDALINALAKESTTFADVRPSRRMKMVADLQSLIPAALNDPETTQESLQKQIADKLAESTDAGLPDDVNTTAQNIASIALGTNQSLKSEVASKLNSCKVTSTEGGPRTLNEGEMNAIVAKVNERIWPALLREKVEEVEKAPRKDIIAAALSDAIKGNADIDPKSMGDLDKKIADASAKLNDFGRKASETEARSFVKDKLGPMAAGGGSLFGNVQIGAGTGVGAGAGALLGLAVIGNASKTSDYVKGIAALALGAGIGAAYDNGAFDSLLKPSGTPKANNGPGGTSVT